MALLGEYLCIRRELKEIPITRYRSTSSDEKELALVTESSFSVSGYNIRSVSEDDREQLRKFVIVVLKHDLKPDHIRVGDHFVFEGDLNKLWVA
ncbi:hypothetical protein Gotri_016304 [Gossypium trilobum]|uniref:Uncharacterized protein n=1 Tax=Gossypium trilobum TaxID=34281 RepID=A0A7J9E3J2_9ROSI|nr:hypothetical protein [Gossypium trilobum]